MLRDDDFARIAALVHKISGIVLAQNKRPLVQSRLSRRLRALGMAGFDVYADFVSRPENVQEQSELLTAVTTNVTSFFREQHHFDTLIQSALPALAARAQAGGRVRIWSAGCSSGEEPYSIAACVLAVLPSAATLDLRILATDIDTTMVARAAAGLFPAEAAAGLPSDHRRRLFTSSPQAGLVQVSDQAKALVTCKALNLQGDWPMRGPFDVIFCRNVVIYFDKSTQERLWQRFADTLVPGGHLMIGHSERVSGPALSLFSAEGITTYRRR